MEYRKLGNCGIFTTSLALGTMLFGESGSSGTSEQESARILDAYLDAGGNHIDTANAYAQGRSERIIGKNLGAKRKNAILATKVHFPVDGGGVNQRGLSRHHIIQSVNDSLKRLQTDYIDLLYMHAWDPWTPIEESLRAFDDLVNSGKVRYIGLSNFKAWQLMKALAVSDSKLLHRFIAAQYQYSLVVRDIEHEFLEIFAREGIGLLPWGPLGGGFLTGKYHPGDRPTEGRISTHPDNTEEAWHRRNKTQNWSILEVVAEIASQHACTIPQIALAWTLHRPSVCSTIIGARTMAQLEDNLGAATIRLSADQMEHLDAVSKPPELYPYRFLETYSRKAED